jgi:hypothetical protein
MSVNSTFTEFECRQCYSGNNNPCHCFEECVAQLDLL